MKKIILFLVAIISIMTACSDDADSIVKSDDIIIGEESEDNITTDKSIFVYVVGEVLNPGVYNLSEGDRVYQAVELAGGFTDEAATETVNMAANISDGEKIVIYSKEQVEAGDVYEDNVTKLININTADEALLMTLPGIGQSRAKDIINYRNDKGRFNTIEDIMNVSGIKEAAFSKIKDLISVN